MEVETKENILSLFKDKSDLSKIKEIIDVDIGKIPIGMSAYQINHFVINEKEFSTPLMKYHQAKTELYSRVNGFIDSYYQMREAQARIKLSKGRIDEFKFNKDLNSIVKEAKIELQQIEIEKNQYKVSSIEQQAKEKLRESLVFYKIFEKYRYLESLPQEELDVMEDEGWRIKSAYYEELPSRYALTAQGFLEYPHEKDGLKGLLLEMNNNGRVPMRLKQPKPDEDVKRLE